MAETLQSPATIARQSVKGETKNRGGRPSTYSPAVGELICSKLAEGETLTAVCRVQGFPSTNTVYQWRKRFPKFDADYRDARAAGMEVMGDQLLEIADDDSLDTLSTVNKKGDEVEVPNHANVQRDRLRVDARKFLMSKLAPRVFGDRVQHEHTGNVTQTVELSDKERMRRLATFLLEDERPAIPGESHLVSESRPSDHSEDGEHTRHHDDQYPDE